MIFVLVGAEGGTRPTSRRRDVAVKLVGCLAAAGLAVAIVHAMPSDPPLQAAFDRSSGGQRPMGLALFRQHGFPLQIVSLLLLSAIVGGVALTLVRTDK
jgi:NADH:ubiquinone oxidoreductase subunit 6 (subunit J)